jgi:hypothetical protein
MAGNSGAVMKLQHSLRISAHRLRTSSSPLRVSSVASARFSVRCYLIASNWIDPVAVGGQHHARSASFHLAL